MLEPFDHPPIVLTLWQPWATLLAYGIKRNETRPKATTALGTTLIHAAKSLPPSDVRLHLLGSTPDARAIREALERIGCKHFQELPTGCIVGEVNFTECITVEYAEPNTALLRSLKDNPNERHYGDFSVGRSIWMGKDHKAYKLDIPYTNGQGYYRRYTGDLKQLELIRNLPDKIDF